MAAAFDALLKLAERLIENEFSENMWRTGYTDFESHDVEVANIAKFSDDALSSFRRVLDDNNLPKTVAECVEKLGVNSGVIMKKLLCLLAAFLKITTKSCKNPAPVILSSACLYLRLAPLSKHLAVGFSIFQQHIYLSVVENIKAINANLASHPSTVAKYLLTALRSFPTFLNDTSLDDGECIKATTDLLSRLAYNDTGDLAQYAGSHAQSVGLLLLEETDVSSLGVGSLALYCIGLMVRRYAESEDIAASIIVSFFPLLLCVGEQTAVAHFPTNIPQALVRQSDILADFLGHLYFDLHIKIPLGNVIQQLIDRVPEKADYRDRVVKVSLRLARCLSSTDLHALVDWATSYGLSSRTNSRATAVELLHGLRSLCPTEATLNLIIRHMLSRCSDSSSIVRNRALALLGDCITSLSQSKSSAGSTSVSGAEPMALDSMETDSNSRSSDEAPVMPRIEVEIAVLTTAIRLADDSRAQVRRTALTLLEVVLPVIAQVCTFTKKDSDIAVVFRRGFETCCQRCVDCSQLVRRQAACTATEVMAKTMSVVPVDVASSDDFSWLGRMWLISVLPLVADSEQRIQEKVVELIASVAIPTAKASDTMQQDQRLAWLLVYSLATKARSNSGNYRTGLTLFIKAKANGTFPRVTGSLKAAAEVIEVANPKFSAAAWFLIGEITAALGAANESQRAVQVLDRLSPGAKWLEACRSQESLSQISITTLECILGVLAAQASYAANTISNVKNSLADDLANRVTKMTIPNALLRTTCCVLFLLSSKHAEKALASLADSLLNSNDKTSNDKLCRCLAAIGCLGELAVGTINSKATLGRIPHISDVVFTKITSLTQDAATDEAVKAQCLFTIGQLCVADRSSALRLVTVISGFLTEIVSANSAVQYSVVVRMAALSVLTDWCMWHTSVAEPYVDQMAVCLRDPQPLMRKHALGVIGRLLDGNFIRWHDALFFRYIVTVIDDEPIIRAAATRYFETIVLPREKQFFSRKFMETIFHFNGYVGARIGQTLAQSQQLTLSQASQSKREERQLATMAVLLGVSGDNNKKRRFGIYRYMLRSMGSYEERLGLLRRLTDGILLAAVREEIDIASQAAGEAVIRDTCLIMCEPSMKFAKVLSHSSNLGDDIGDDEVEEKDENAAETRAEARRAILAQAVRHVVCKDLLPALIAVRAFIERTKPSLHGCICDLLVATYTEYKADLSDALSDDPELVRELEFHMRQAQQKQKERAQLAAFNNQQAHREQSDRESSVVLRGHEDNNNDDNNNNNDDEGDDASSTAKQSSSRRTVTESENSGPVVARPARHKKHVVETVSEEDEVVAEEEPVAKSQTTRKTRQSRQKRKVSAVNGDEDDDD